MKNTLKLSFIVLLAIFTINTSFAGWWSLNQIDYNYTWSLNNSPVWSKLTIKWYINPSSLQFADWWLYWINIKYWEYFLESRGFYNITHWMSFWLFHPESDIESREIIRGDGSSYYSRYFDNDYNKWLMLFASKSLIDSINYYDPTYYELWDNKIYNNWKSINRNYFINWNFINSYGDNIKWWTDIKWNIVASAWWNMQIEKWNVLIEWKIEEININEDIFMCDMYWKSFKWEYKSYGDKWRCLTLVNDIKRDFYTSKIDSETFKELFTRTWKSHTIQSLKINTKVFVMDKITVNGITYWQKAPIYTLNSNYKNSLDKALVKLNKYSPEKKENIQSKIKSLLETQRYGSKNYTIFKYLQTWMDTHYSIDKKQEASIILWNIRDEFDWSDELMKIIREIIWDWNDELF